MIHEAILDHLRRSDAYLSGEDLSALLKISRQALWKHIQQLKEEGYEIEAVPHLGYRLVSSPDRLFPCEIATNLGTKFIGKKICYFDTLASTMDYAEELGLKNAPEGTVVVSEAQTKGRGRMNRQWASLKYKGIYLSLILRPKILPNATPVLTLLCAVAVCDAITEVCGLEPKIKWPNDILIHNKKAAGILTELNAEMDAVKFVVIGLGINVNNDAHQLVEGATSLKDQKKDVVSRVRLLQEILRCIEEKYLLCQKKGSAFILEQWRAYSLTLGKRVRIASHHTHKEGQAIDVDSDGALLVRTDSGLIERVTAGDVVHCR
jgi:BirA family biotin operon repressor/biotin-[acetyl-CoA-carboxylase] ligase